MDVHFYERNNLELRCIFYILVKNKEYISTVWSHEAWPYLVFNKNTNYFALSGGKVDIAFKFKQFRQGTITLSKEIYSIP